MSADDILSTLPNYECRIEFLVARTTSATSHDSVALHVNLIGKLRLVVTGDGQVPTIHVVYSVQQRTLIGLGPGPTCYINTKYD